MFIEDEEMDDLISKLGKCQLFSKQVWKNKEV